MPTDIDNTEKDILDDYTDEQGNIDLNSYLADEEKKALNARKLIIEVNFENKAKLLKSRKIINKAIDNFINELKTLDGYINATAEDSMENFRYGLENTLKAGKERLLAQDKGGLAVKVNYMATEHYFKEIWENWPDKDKRGSQAKFIRQVITNVHPQAPTVTERTLRNWLKKWKSETA